MTLNSMPTLNIDFDAIAVGWLALLNEYQLVIMAYGMMPLEAYEINNEMARAIYRHAKMVV